MLTFMAAIHFLKAEGRLVMKTLTGPTEDDNFVPPSPIKKRLFGKFFDEFHREKPLASRSTSNELFYVGKGYNPLLGQMIVIY
jgi:23S rRNA U2552 (ribose-2'-O)-methylase RlmE/FtsJ